MWNSSNFILLNEDPEVKYYPNSKETRNNIHDGQRKLCLVLLQFLTEFVHVENAVVIYVGAASGSNIIFNAELFPNIMWYLYDSNPFDERLYSMKNVTIYKRYFTDEDAEQWRNVQERDENIYFVSDIRVEAEKEEDGNATFAFVIAVKDGLRIFLFTVTSSTSTKERKRRQRKELLLLVFVPR